MSTSVPQPAEDAVSTTSAHDPVPLPLENPTTLATRLGPVEQRLVVLDFDGVLSHIVDHPDQAVAVAGALDAIRRVLARTSVAVVSGRPIADLTPRLAGLPLTLAGAHGAELVHADGAVDHLVDPTEVAGTLDAVEGDIRALVDDQLGWLVERKPTSLAVHHRLASHDSVDERLPRVRATLEHHADNDQFTVLAGKAVLELRPAGVDKGRALERIAARVPARRPLVVGDDLTDEDAFVVANALDGDAILVADEPRPTVASSRLRDPEAVVAFLSALARA